MTREADFPSATDGTSPPPSEAPRGTIDDLDAPAPFPEPTEAEEDAYDEGLRRGFLDAVGAVRVLPAEIADPAAARIREQAATWDIQI